MIVLSSDIAVKDVLDRKSGNFSDRPDMYMAQDIASGGLRLVVMVSLSGLSGTELTQSRNMVPLGE